MMAKAKKRKTTESPSAQHSAHLRRATSAPSIRGKTKKLTNKSRTTPHDSYYNEPTLNESTSSHVEVLPRKKVRPKEHWESTYIDGRVYVPTLDDFNADTSKRGSMLDEVSYLPIEDLASLLCGSRIFLMIRHSVVGQNILDLCRELKHKHSLLDLRVVANNLLVRRHSARLLLSEDCTEQFLAPAGIGFYFELVLKFILSTPHWDLGMRRRFCRHLAQRLAEARLGMALVDDSFYEINLCNFTSIDPSDVQQATGLPLKEVTMLLECLFANAMRFFVLYCVHALRNQVVAKFSKSGEAFFRLKILDTTSVSSPWTVDSELNSFGVHFRFCISDEEMSACIPLGELHSPTLEDLQGGSDCASLVYQVAHLPAPEITRLVLGERLFARLREDSPVFIAQMNEYAELLKFSQSRNRYGNYLYIQTAKRMRGFVRISMIITYAVKVLGALFDWMPSTKKQKLVKTLGNCILNWNKHGQLFIESDFDCDSFDEYYVLKSFEGHSQHWLPNTLLKEISRRFDHFFLVYVIHALREHTTVHKTAVGSIRFLFKEDSAEDAFRSDILAPCDPQPSVSGSISCSASLQPVDSAPTILPSCGTNIPKEPNFGSLAQAGIMPRNSSERTPQQAGPANTTSVAQPEATSQVEATEASTKGMEDGHTDEEWEMKLYERVKQDPTVPHYFKTTFGILVANNRNLREEKNFLHSQLGLS